MAQTIRLQASKQGAGLAALDETGVTRYHWRTVLTSGMGFFTDAYDLFIIGTVTTLLTPLWNLSTGQLAVLNSTSLLAAVLGALIFGRLMDRLGRKRMYGVEVILLTIGALASAFSANFIQLVIFRFIVGLGVGGDYPTSAVITSEFANRPNRGRLVTMVFAMQGLGLLAGPVVAAALLGAGVPQDVAWRIMLGLGAIPAASVIYLRRRISETPRYTLQIQGDAKETSRVIELVTGQSSEVEAPVQSQSRKSSLADPVFLRRLLGTAGSWFLIDVAFYGNGVSSGLIMKSLLPGAPMVATILVSAAIFLVAALPGYFVAARLMDTVGRKRIQWVGFLVMAAAYTLLFAVPGIMKIPFLFLVIYAISYFFIEFGPNTTTFVFPSEVFPTEIRGFGHGLSASGGKLGAFIAAFLFPILLNSIGLPNLLGILAVASVIGVALTLFALPEPKQRALEELNDSSHLAG